MFSTYAEALSLPGALRFSLAGLLARMPIALLGIGTVLFVQLQTGSYALAGALAAVLVCAQAIGNPLLAKAADARGQARVMIPAAIVHVLSLGGLIASVYAQLHPVIVVLLALLTGASLGPAGSLVRARWIYAVKSPQQLNAAFSWEAMMDELLFITGPVLVTVMATTLFSSAGLALSLVVLSVGACLLYMQKASEPPLSRATGTKRGRVLGNPGILVVVVCYLLLGMNFGAIDIIAIAFADEQGAQPLGGLLLGIFAAGSLVAGAGYGTIRWKASAATRLVVANTALALGLCLLLLPQNLFQMGAVMFIVGFAIAPTLIAGSTLLQELAPQGRTTEALSWSGTSMGIGVALGSPAAGAIIDGIGAQEAFWLVAGLGLVSAVAGWLGRSTMKRA